MTSLDVGAQPPAVLELAAGRVTPRAKLSIRDHGQLERPTLSRLKGVAAGQSQEAIGQSGPSLFGQPTPDDHQNVEVTSRSQPSSPGRAVQIRADEITSKDLAQPTGEQRQQIPVSRV